MEILDIEKERVVGIETEYGLNKRYKVAPVDSSQNQNHFTPRQFNESVPEDVKQSLNGFNLFGRLYLDLGNGEASTSEVTSLDGIITSVFTGEVLITDTVAAMGQGEWDVYKRSVDTNGVSRAEHENYLTGGATTDEQIERVYSFLAARVPLTGPGAYLPRNPGKVHGPYHFAVDQRGLVTEKGTANISHLAAKPFRKQTEENFDASDETKRVQLVTGSHNMNPFAYAIRILGTSAVLRLAEYDRYPLAATIVDPVAAIRNFARDPAMVHRVETADGKHRTALDICEISFEAASKLPLVKDEAAVVAMGLEAVSDLKAGRLLKWVRHIEWIAKKQILDAAAVRNADHPNLDAFLAALDIQMHKIGRGTISDKLRSSGRVAMLPSVEAVQAARTTPPDPTRALVRNAYMKEVYARGANLRNIDYNRWGANDSPELYVLHDAYGEVAPRDITKFAA